MKNFYLMILICLMLMQSKVYAQQTDDYKHTADSLFLHLDKTGVGTSVLYDRVFPFAALNNFNS